VGELIVMDELPDFGGWGAGVITVSPRCLGHSRPHGFDGQAYLRAWRAELDAVRAAIVRDTTVLPGFRELIDTLRWGEMR
jgi:hypothetical protein